MKNKYSFTRHVFIAFLLLIFLVMLSTLLLQSFVFDNTFGKYLEDQSISEDLSWVSFIESSFASNQDPSFDLQRAAMMNELSFAFLDENGNIIGQIVSDMMGMGHMHTNDTILIERDYPLKSGPFSVVRIGRPPNTVLALPEATFKKNLTRGYFLIGFIALALASILAFWFSKRVAFPIQRLQKYAESIAQQNWESDQATESSVLEIHSLHSSLTNLAMRLQTQDRLRRRLTTDMSHELRTPLSVLLNQLEAVHDGVLPLTQERIASLVQEIHRLTRLVGRIEELNTLTAQKNKEVHAFDLTRVLAQMTNVYQPLFQKKEIAFETRIARDLQLVSQEDAIRQILFNLIENALRYTDRGGKVLLKAEKKDHFIHISIQDTGIGIPEESLPYIFDRFYRVDESRSQSTGGSGLGLSIVKELVEVLQGTITCESELEKGTIFSIQLPSS